MTNLFLRGLAITITFETIILVIIMTRVYKSNVSLSKMICGGFFASMMTLPYLYFVMPDFLSGNSYVIVAESVAVIVEAIFYFHYFDLNKTDAFILSLLANCISFLTGVILFW